MLGHDENVRVEREVVRRVGSGRVKADLRYKYPPQHALAHPSQYAAHARARVADIACAGLGGLCSRKQTFILITRVSLAEFCTCWQLR